MDLTTTAKVKNYGDKITTGTDDALIGDIVTAMSAAVESYCNQTFGTITVDQSVTGRSYRAKVDPDGLLTFYPAHNNVTAVTALQFRYRGSLTWQTLNPANVVISNHQCGPVLRLYNADFSAYRRSGATLQVQTALTAGYADTDSLPKDLEFAVRRLAWWAYKQRSAPMEKTAIPELGVLIVPSAWPADVLMYLAPYVNYLT